MVFLNPTWNIFSKLLFYFHSFPHSQNRELHAFLVHISLNSSFLAACLLLLQKQASFKFAYFFAFGSRPFLLAQFQVFLHFGCLFLFSYLHAYLLFAGFLSCFLTCLLRHFSHASCIVLDCFWAYSVARFSTICLLAFLYSYFLALLFSASLPSYFLACDEYVDFLLTFAFLWVWTLAICWLMLSQSRGCMQFST